MTHRMLFSLIALTCFGALSSAFIAQYIFHLDPCAFCIYERYPYALGFLFALMGFWKPVYGSFWKKTLGFCFLVGAGITFYHILIEHKLIAPPQACVSAFDITDATTIADLEAEMTTQARVVRCDIVPIRIFGLSLAEYNFLLSFFLVFICLRKNP